MTTRVWLRRRANPSRTPKRSAVARGSRLADGSSSTRMRGPKANPAATATRCCSPPDSVSGRRERKPSSPTNASAASTAASISAVGTRTFSSPNATSSSTESVQNWASGSWKTRPTSRASRDTGWSATDSPATVTEPVSRDSTTWGIRPSRQSASVLLPEPLGPSTSTASPGRTVRSTSCRTVRGRSGYMTETPSRMIAGGVEPAAARPPAASLDARSPADTAPGPAEIRAASVPTSRAWISAAPQPPGPADLSR